MTKTVYDFINKQSGNGFNEKFENAVFKMIKKEDELNKSIAIKEQRLKILKKRETDISELLHQLDFITNQVKYIHNNLERNNNLEKNNNY